MNWLRRMLRLPPPESDQAVERADHLLENVKSIRITTVPKNARALAELRRLEGHARR